MESNPMGCNCFFSWEQRLGQIFANSSGVVHCMPCGMLSPTPDAGIQLSHGYMVMSLLVRELDTLVHGYTLKG